MELAIHLRDPEMGAESLRPPAQALADRLNPFYPGRTLAIASLSLDRIYIGDEFCPHRMPLPAQIEAYCSLSHRHGTGLTLLTPVLTDDELDRCAPLFDALAEHMPDAEIVVNDWGVLSVLKERHPSLRFAAGRVLDKGFKDPRLDMNVADVNQAQRLGDILGQATFSRPEFQSLAQQIGIERLESDLLPYGDHATLEKSHLKQSIYFPFGYITSGRVCWIASFNQFPPGKFVPAKTCAGLCRRLMLELHSREFQFRIFQSGNTLFYLYTQTMMEELLKGASNGSVRLVFQGLSL